MRGRVRHGDRRILASLVRGTVFIAAALALAFAVAALATARSAVPDLYPPAPGAPTIMVHVVNHGLHSAIIVPVDRLRQIGYQEDRQPLITVGERFYASPWVEIGWGDEGFYRYVPTWWEIDWGIAIAAITGTGGSSVFHVVGLPDDPARVFPASDILTLSLSEAGFSRLANAVAEGFMIHGGAPVDLGVGIYGDSNFYRSDLAYSALMTCNHWTADVLHAAGLPASAVTATLPAGLMAELRWRAVP
ncbi:DUF2459 domain-containing protein [Chthonobacter albigriseus]|uniref:DUF2459 domain-containing protein n=1 Tax=Chthonobacter albigriseus TaxID=1683161 RepID=UPI0015EF7547|nr:DUF2459 domain-containing protein [Chthonobacter albigriseus]